jgi:hypothetical protein
VLYEVDHGGHPTIVDFIKYNLDTESIVAYSESSGNGGGGHTRITALRK